MLAQFLDRYPEGVFSPLARDRLAELEWNAVKATRSAQEIDAYLKRWPEGRFTALAQSRLACIASQA